jgi:hypothetical protein
LAKSDIFTGEEKFEPNQLDNLMELALIENKPNFVELLLEVVCFLVYLGDILIHMNKEVFNFI